MTWSVRGGRRLWAVLVTAALVFAVSVLAQGWLVFRAHDGTLDLAYLNKRLDGHVFVTTPVVTAYFLIAYAVFRRAWRRRTAPISLGAICAKGAMAVLAPAAILVFLGSPGLALLVLALGVTAFGWAGVILGDGETVGLGRGLRKGLGASAAISLCVGLIFTLWLVWSVLWRDLDVDYFVAKEGMIAYAPVAIVGFGWLIAACCALLGVCSFALFLTLMIRSLGRLIRSGNIAASSLPR